MESTNKKINWWNPIIGEKEHEYIKEALDNNFPNEGRLTEKFQDNIRKLLNCRYAVAVTSGTSAIFLSLKALGIGYGDEVIIPDMTFIATANAVEMTGAKPVLVDINPKDLTISPEEIKDKITNKTKAVIPVHVSGRGADMEKVIEVAENKNIYVVEDAAEAFTSKYKGRHLGAYGIAGCFSFSPHKIITTGQGGMVVTNDKNIYSRLLELKDHGRMERGTGGDDLHNSIGYNFKFTDIQAAVGLGQLHYLAQRIERIKKTYNLYKKNLHNLSDINVFNFDIENGEFPQWVDAVYERREELNEYLKSKNIEIRNYWHPVHTQKPYRLPDNNFKNSIYCSKRAFWLPSAYTLLDEDVDFVCHHLRNFLK